jgi:DNA invertase Pin-like site-specific DNA recombinase
MRAGLYARVSTEEQTEGYSIDAQRRAFQTLCEGRMWATYEEYVEEGKSARTEDINKRPAFKRMIADALAGQFDVLVVHKLDRFSRNLRVTLEYFDRLLKAGVAFVSISEQMDFTTPSGKVHLALLGAFAQYYSDNLSQETKKGWAERKAQGLYCGALPFGAAKGGDGVPIPDMQERKTTMDDREAMVRNYEGLKMAFEMAAKGETDRQIAAVLNTCGYRTTGTHGTRPFSKDTVKDMLKNRFYVGEIPDGKGGWMKAKHQPFVDNELFEDSQKMREHRRHARHTINVAARTYSLSTLIWCNKCKSKIRIQMNQKTRARIYCSGRAKGDTGCDFRGTFLDTYEAQIEWYLENFEIPQDYQEKILEAHGKLQAAYSDVEANKAMLEKRLARVRELYEWGDMTKQEYQQKRDAIQREMKTLVVADDSRSALSKLAHFLANVADAWREANQEQRNKLAKALFEEIWVEDERVVVVKPRPELEPFFKLNFGCHAKDIASDPGGIRGLMCNTLLT